MTPEMLFSLCNLLVVPAWLLLILAPRWMWTQRLVLSAAVPLVLAALYVYLIAAYFRPGEGGFGSLGEVSRLFSNPHLLLAGWVHYLAFDLFVGSWEVRDARRRELPHLLVVPCLLLTFLLGPAGLLAYVVMSRILSRRARAGSPA